MEQPDAPAPSAPLAAGVRIAAIDIGTNSIHMVVARATTTGFELVDSEREVVQTGRGSFATGRLRADAIARTVDALARFVELARRHDVDRILCTATAAVREARNGGVLLRAAQRRTGVTPRVIPAEEEGRLIWLAVRSALALDEQPVLLLDIGGGSVQLVVADRERIVEAHSVPLGALRLTETMLASDPPGADELRRLGARVRDGSAAALASVRARSPVRVIGSSGAIHALAEVAYHEANGTPIPQLNGHLFRLEELQRLADRLAGMPLARREALAGLDAHRAEIVVPGAIVLRHVLETLEATAITLSDYGVREGLVTDYLLGHAGEVRALGAAGDLRMRSVLGLLDKFRPEEREQVHARHVAALALALYDGLDGRHALPPRARALLEYAALLHDVGVAVAYEDHAGHSDYLVRNGNLRGLSADEVGMIALATRYHGKQKPSKARDPRVRALGDEDRRVLRWLAALLRVAEGLDRSHYQRVRSVRVASGRGRVTLVAATLPGGAPLELWAARRRAGLLERLLEQDVRITTARQAAPAAS